MRKPLHLNQIRVRMKEERFRSQRAGAVVSRQAEECAKNNLGYVRRLWHVL